MQTAMRLRSQTKLDVSTLSRWHPIEEWPLYQSKRHQIFIDDSDYNTYTSVDGVLEPVIYPATGQPVYAFEDGKTYNLSVRAVKIGDDGKEVYGDWSNAFAYKVTASDAGTSEKPAAVSGVNVNTEASEQPCVGTHLTM